MGKVLDRVLKTDSVKGTIKFVLVVIAYHADDKGECFPSLKLISLETGLSVRHCQRLIEQLEELGELEIVSGGGRKSNTYRLTKYLQDSKINVPECHPTLDMDVTPDILENPVSIDIHVTPQVSECHPSLDTDVTPPMTSMSNELTYNKHIRPLKAKSKEKSIVAPVGSDTAPIPLLESQTTTPEGKDTHQSQEVVKPTNTATPPIEGVPKRKSTPKTNSVDNTTIQTNTPPIAPPHADKVRVLSDHQKMVGAIVKSFGWSFDKMTKNNRGLVGKVARELIEASATPDQIPALYEFCKGQKWSNNGIFSPAALSSQWANFCANQTAEGTGEVFRVWQAPEGYVGVKFDYRPRLIDTITVDDSDGIEELTPAQIREQFTQTIAKLAQKMSAIEETPIPDDDPMKEVLTW